MKTLIKNKTVFVAFLLLCAGIISSCSEEFLDRSPLDTPSPDNFFVNEKSARQANTAIYNYWLRDADMFQRDMLIIFEGMTDNALWRQNRSASIQQERWDIIPTHGPITEYWRRIYRSINACNFSIENIPIATDENFADELRDQYVAEARFMRGFNYLFLVTFYGEVPLITDFLSDFSEFSNPRASKQDLYAQILEDFTFAKDNLPDKWSADYSGRPTRAAGAAYLAKALLYMGNYSGAETAARDAINVAERDGFALMDDYSAIFVEAMDQLPEMVFSFAYVENSDVVGTNMTVQLNPNPTEPEFKEVLNQAWGYMLPQRSLYDEYENDDPRRGYTMFAPGDFYGIYSAKDKTFKHLTFDEMAKDTVSVSKSYAAGDSIFWQYYWSQTGLGCKKMIDNLANLGDIRNDGQDIPLLRMADLYLFLAEALAEQGNAEALVWVNKVRSRSSVNLPARTVGDGRPGDGSFVDIVRHERRVELGLEGQRLFDIMRWGNIDEIFNGPEPVKRHFYWDWSGWNDFTKYDKPNIEIPKDLLWPIPQSELDTNPMIKENNPGY
jgi:hypothetical protein